jgi:hypothetical protein
LLYFWFFCRRLSFVLSQDARDLFEGVTYIRDERTALRPMVIHVMLIDLQADGIDFIVTPTDDLPDYDYSARTTTQFIAEFDVQLAINGDFFGPVRDDGNATESGVDAHGLTILDNVTQTIGFASPNLISTLYLDDQNQVSFNEKPDNIDIAISSKYMLVVDNEYTPIEDSDPEFVNSPHPRSAIGLSEDGQTLILMVVDGRQPTNTEGATLPELATFLKEYGATTALNLDGGGSASLAIQGQNGMVNLINSPVNYDAVNVERPIANHLGVYAKPLQ